MVLFRVGRVRVLLYRDWRVYYSPVCPNVLPMSIGVSLGFIHIDWRV